MYTVVHNLMANEKIYIYGKHAVTEALSNTPFAVEKVFLTTGTQDQAISELAIKAKISIEPFSDTVTTNMDKQSVHQGVAALVVLEKLLRDYKTFRETLNVTPKTALVLLGEVQDPQNVGAIIRSAAAFGVAGVLIPEHNQAQITATVAKVSAGMVFRVPLITIGNANTTVRDLKDRGFWVYGLDETGANPLPKETFDAPALFILGNEATGIREKTRELCDILLSIPMNPQCESLNVAASGAVVLYAWSAQHPDAMK